MYGSTWLCTELKLLMLQLQQPETSYGDKRAVSSVCKGTVYSQALELRGGRG